MAEPSNTPRAKWPQISDIIPNHDGDRPSATDALVGLRTYLGGEIQAAIEFDSDRCAWRENGREELNYEYEALGLGRRLFFVDAMPVVPNLRSLTMILDLALMRALVVEVTFPKPEAAQSAVLARLAATGSQSAVKVRYRQSGLGTSDASPFKASGALAGRHLRYTYSATHIYDHIYHSERFYSWFCREGPDKGLGDFEELDAFELAARCYLVCWREKLLPCVGIMVEDHQSMRATGKICGVDAYTGEIGNSRVGARLEFVADCAAT